MPKPVTPLVTVDCVIELQDHPGEIVIIERRNPPAGYALPGGFVDVGEDLAHAAAREAQEETGLEVTLSGLLGLYSDPQRDPRGHTVSAVFVATAAGTPAAGDDALAVWHMPPAEVSGLVFDHGRILEDYLAAGELCANPPFIR